MKPPISSLVNFQTLFESAPNLYLVLSKKFSIVAVSNAYLQATMTEREKILGCSVFDVFNSTDNSSISTMHNLRISLQRVISTYMGDTMPVVKYDITKPGSSEIEERYWSVHNAPIFDEKGELVYIIQRVEDVTAFIKLKQQEHEITKENESLRSHTERIESEIYMRAQEISEANQSLEKANEKLAEMFKESKKLDELKTNFFANISHELRTPLTLILGPVLKLLASDKFSEEVRHDLKVIERNAQLLLKQVNDILDITKLEANKVILEYAEVDLSQTVQELADSFKFFAKEQNIDFIVKAPLACYVEVDKAKLQRILLNLLSNAFKFTEPNGRIELILTKTQDQAIFSVSDTGPGIPESMREVIFERFHQLDGSSRRRKGGTGLGLAIVKELAELHQGSIEVDKAQEGGAWFKVTLPVQAPAHTSVTKASQVKDSVINKFSATELNTYIPQEKAALSLLPTIKHGALVLVVEDNPEMNDFLTRILSANYRIETAYNGKEGLEKALQYLPDLIISDVMMPEMSGDEMVRELFAHQETKDIPVLMLTAKMDDRLKVELLKEGVQDYISKPFSVEELSVKVQRLITERRKRIADQEKLIQKLTISNQELERFAYIASHDLKSPLRSIDNLSQWIEEDLGGLVQGVTKEYMERLRNQVHLMEKLLDNVLEYSSIEYKLEQRSQKTDITTLMNNVSTLLNPPKGFTVKIANNFYPLHVQQMPLQQVLYNLVQNAIMHHDRETGVIEVNIEENEMQYIFSICDDGPGIAPEYHDKIFDMLQTLKPRSQTGGTGIGLALVRKIVTIHGGEVTVKSEPGHGSLFRFTWQKLEEEKKTENGQ